MARMTRTAGPRQGPLTEGRAKADFHVLWRRAHEHRAGLDEALQTARDLLVAMREAGMGPLADELQRRNPLPAAEPRAR